jgi:hypothetical protein
MHAVHAKILGRGRSARPRPTTTVSPSSRPPVVFESCQAVGARSSPTAAVALEWRSACLDHRFLDQDRQPSCLMLVCYVCCVFGLAGSISCSAGMYLSRCNGTSAGSCLFCPAGTYTSSSGALNCTSAVPGTYSAKSGASVSAPNHHPLIHNPFTKKSTDGRCHNPLIGTPSPSNPPHVGYADPHIFTEFHSHSQGPPQRRCVNQATTARRRVSLRPSSAHCGTDVRVSAP